ncbi:MAG: hypothetical protein KC486_06240 [Myxococcales bacterium]|nr:hypothetical protein [Myxococcales bacterium]
MVRSALARSVLVALLPCVLAVACNSSGDEASATETTTSTASATGSTTGSTTDATTDDTSTSTSGDTSTSTSTSGDTSTSTTGESTTTTTGESEGDTSTSTTGEIGPMVDVSDPQLYSFEFTPDEADAAASQALATQLAYLDTQVEPLGKLVVYLHGAGAPQTCGSKAHGQVLAGMGFHVFSPCYISDYGVGNCGDNIGGCRLEAFEGVDHHPFVDITPENSAEVRIVKGLQYLQEQHPGGDWAYFLDGDQPRWEKIVISGISHGASSSGVIGMNRIVDRVVMLSGPLDSGQAWLKGQPMTAIDRFFAFTHTADNQHPGHLQSFTDMMLVGEPTAVDGAEPPYSDSHRLMSSADTDNGHVAVQAGGSSPKDGNNEYVYMPVWRYLYGVEP